jgi:hypothetical protein
MFSPAAPAVPRWVRVSRFWLEYSPALLLLIIGGCGDGTVHPFSKPEGQLAAFPPPAENYTTAGPGAEYEIDYETLYGPNRSAPTTEAAASQRAATAMAGDQSNVPAAGTGENRHPISAVAVPLVQGASESGNAELTTALREALSAAGWPVLQKPRKDALTISGKVSLGSPGQQPVDIVWTVTTADGHTVGSLRQTNKVPAGSLGKTWGDTAIHIANAAAGGIFDLVKSLR